MKKSMEVLGHVVAAVVIVAAGMPLAKWYFVYSPLWGVDFYYTASLVEQFARSPVVWPALGWNYAWFGGWPLVSSYPILHLFFIWPLSIVFGLITSVKMWMVVTLFGYYLGLYVCFWTISRNRILGVVMAIAATYSVGVYGALMWGGSLPSHATQMFYPWAIWPVINFVKGGKWKWILAGGVIAGLAILGHPQIVIVYVFPTVFILLTCWFGVVKFLNRLGAGVVYGVVAILVGLPILVGSAGDALKVLVLTGTHQVEVASSTVKIPSTFSQDVDNFHKAQPKRIVTDTNFGLFELGVVGVGLWVVGLVIRLKQKSWAAVVASAVLAIFYTIYVTIYAYGVSIYHGGWYRLFWSTPLWLGMVVAAMWGSIREVLIIKLGKKAMWGGMVLLGVLAGGIGLFGFVRNTKDLRGRIEARSTTSSAFPDILNIWGSEKDFLALKKKMVPAWLDGDNVNYRLYAADQTVNIWWNSMYKMPLARGYYDPPVSPRHRGYFFWVDAALSRDSKDEVDQLVGSFGYAPQAAKNNTLYLVDWFAIKYIEAERVGLGNYSALPKWLTTEEFIKRNEEVVFSEKDVYHPSGKQILKYWEVENQFVSPIAAAVNVPVVGVVGTEPGYENVTRAMADANLNSQKLITVYLGRSLDNLGERELGAVDGLILYDYDYFNKEKAWGLIGRMLETGKKVFIDTGVENKESNASSLPPMFPMTNLSRMGLSMEWQWRDADPQLFDGVAVEGFAPPVFDGQPWSFGFPGEGGLKPGAQVLARNQGKIIMARMGYKKGEVIWSGMNLPYHVSRFHAGDEIKLWENVVKGVVGNSDKGLATTQYQFLNAGERMITTSGAKGILVKEEAYPGWWAWEGWKTRPILKAGPSWPGFMYIPLSDTKNHTIKLHYMGSMGNWILTGGSLMVIVFVLDSVLFGNGLGRRVYRRLDKLIGGWLKKDEE